MREYKELNTFLEWTAEEKDHFSVNVIKGLIMDGVRKANSGHPGGAMSSADFAYILFSNYLELDPDNPNWANRDRFVLSAGHESMLLYSLLHLNGWLTLEDLQSFRQLNSKTPGHPEVELPGVECTTGPLGQGVGMGVGMAVAEAILNHSFDALTKPNPINHYTYILAGDGDLQEPIVFGAAALAGHWKLGKLIMYYDSNDAQISGKIGRSDSTNYASVFEALGWNVHTINGHDHEAIRNAIETAKVIDIPSLIIGETTMAKGTATREGDHETHGAPLPQDEIDATKEKMGLPKDSFYAPDEIIRHYQSRFDSLKTHISVWNNKLNTSFENDDFKNLWDQTISEILPSFSLPEFNAGESIATRKAFGTSLDHFATQLPNLVGGSADLEPSNYTGNFAKMYGDFNMANHGGRNFAFGVREFPMAVLMNGIALHGGLIPFGGTFLVFSDYERPALRMAALQGIRVIHEFTHDSFYVGEDGPTHQPIEHAMALRTIPNYNVFRPGDAKETAACFALALESKETPSALLLTRQGLPVSQLDQSDITQGVSKGAYIFQDCEGHPDLIFLATGSEVSLAVETAHRMEDKSIRIISMPCLELFEEQSNDYKQSIIPPRGVMIISFEAGISFGWEKYIGPNGLSIAINQYGASAPANELADSFGFTPEKAEKKIRNHLSTLL